MGNSERCEVHFLGWVSMRVPQHPDMDPISHFILHSSSLLETSGTCSKSHNPPPPLSRDAFGCCVSSRALSCSPTAPGAAEGTATANTRHAAHGSSSQPRTGPAPLWESIRQQLLSHSWTALGRPHLLVAFGGKWESSHGAEFRGLYLPEKRC